MIMSEIESRVVVTGMGILSPLGLDTATTWEGLISGKSGIDYITLFDTDSLDTKFGGEVKGFCATDFISRKEARHMDRFAQLAVAASQEAMEQSRLQINSGNQDDIGIILGSGIGGLTTLFEQMKVLLAKGPSRVSPFLVPMMITDMAASQVSISLGLKGPNLCTTSACSSGSDAIGAAYDMIKHGDTQAMLAGGGEPLRPPIGLAAFNAVTALATRSSDPELASRPFDATRDGFVISEGAAVLVLESLAHAQKREANILAEIVAYGASADAFHVTQPTANGEGAARAVQIALDKAKLRPAEID